MRLEAITLNVTSIVTLSELYFHVKVIITIDFNITYSGGGVPNS